MTDFNGQPFEENLAPTVSAVDGINDEQLAARILEARQAQEYMMMGPDSILLRVASAITSLFR